MAVSTTSTALHDLRGGRLQHGRDGKQGLNIFNSRYLLADKDTATDTDYQTVDAIVAYEYFHNWSGNRVTCRDWFQLSLKVSPCFASSTRRRVPHPPLLCASKKQRSCSGASSRGRGPHGAPDPSR